MQNVVERAFPCRAVDTASKLNPDLIQSVRDAGYACIIRYVPHANGSGMNDISADEASAILESGLALMLVQHVRKGPWHPADFSGRRDAESAIAAAEEARYLRGAHIYLDLEDIAGPGAPTKAFAEDWANTIVDAGYLAGAYVGFSVPLGPLELYNLHRITTYWSDAGPRQVAKRGFAMKQHAQITIDGVAFDPDVVQADNLDETPAWMVQRRDDLPNV